MRAPVLPKHDGEAVTQCERKRQDPLTDGHLGEHAVASPLCPQCHRVFESSVAVRRGPSPMCENSKHDSEFSWSALGRSQVTALLGPRQCGKTTLARLLGRKRKLRYFDLEDEADRSRLRWA